MTTDELITALRVCASDIRTCKDCPMKGHLNAQGKASCHDTLLRLAAQKIEKQAGSEGRSCSFVIPGRLPGLNEYIKAERSQRLAAVRMKNNAEQDIIACIRAELCGRLTIIAPVKIEYRFFEKDRRRDKDNISGYAHKLIQDSLVKSGVLKNDGWSAIVGYEDKFFVDKRRPRIEVYIIEVFENDGKRVF